jgi:hypothetical protein
MDIFLVANAEVRYTVTIAKDIRKKILRSNQKRRRKNAD